MKTQTKPKPYLNQRRRRILKALKNDWHFLAMEYFIQRLQKSHGKSWKNYGTPRAFWSFVTSEKTRLQNEKPLSLSANPV